MKNTEQRIYDLEQTADLKKELLLKTLMSEYVDCPFTERKLMVSDLIDKDNLYVPSDESSHRIEDIMEELINNTKRSCSEIYVVSIGGYYIGFAVSKIMEATCHLVVGNELKATAKIFWILRKTL